MYNVRWKVGCVMVPGDLNLESCREFIVRGGLIVSVFCLFGECSCCWAWKTLLYALPDGRYDV